MVDVPAPQYAPWVEKHKAPRGFGAHCPDEMGTAQAQALLDRAVRVEGDQRLYCVDGEWLFVAHETSAGVWHGFPRPGMEVHDDILGALLKCGHINKRQKHRLRRQKSLPRAWPWPRPNITT